MEIFIIVIVFILFLVAILTGGYNKEFMNRVRDTRIIGQGKAVKNNCMEVFQMKLTSKLYIIATNVSFLVNAIFGVFWAQLAPVFGEYPTDIYPMFVYGPILAILSLLTVVFAWLNRPVIILINIVLFLCIMYFGFFFGRTFWIIPIVVTLVPTAIGLKLLWELEG